MGDRDIVNEIENTGTDQSSISARLGAVLNIQQKNSARLSAVISVANNPGPPDGPTLCDSIITEAQNTISLAQQLKRTFGIVG